MIFSGIPDVVDNMILSICEYDWGDNIEFYNSILYGFIYLKPKYEILTEKLFKESIENNKYQRLGRYEVNQIFFNEFKNEIDLILNAKFKTFEDKFTKQLDQFDIIKAFNFIPDGTKESHKIEIVLGLVQNFATSFFKEKSELRFDNVHKFLTKLISFCLESNFESISIILKPLIDGFKPVQNSYLFFRELIRQQDKIKKNDEFWFIWELFYDCIFNIAREDCFRYDCQLMLTDYFFAYPFWDTSKTSWHTLTSERISFFSRIVIDFQECPIVLFSISKVINDVGSNYLIEGLNWVYTLVENFNRDKFSEKKQDTIYYLELFCKRYIIKYKELLKIETEKKRKMIRVLDFLEGFGSAEAFLLRERIL
ncbi:MAG: hypothetical protein KDK36_11050 [Leptospiraceae bacterium]|nr:hypothetical protein [Leptospiraceae bacterium]